MTRHGTREQSGAAASTTATVEALAGLFSVICITLSDDSTADARSAAANAARSAGVQQLTVLIVRFKVGSSPFLARPSLEEDFCLTNACLPGGERIQSSSDALVALKGLQQLAVAVPGQHPGQDQKALEVPVSSRRDAPNAQVTLSDPAANGI